MLALNRRVNEEIVLFKDDVEIGSFKIISIGGGKVCIGFGLTDDYKVLRRELLLGDEPKVKP